MKDRTLWFVVATLLLPVAAGCRTEPPTPPETAQQSAQATGVAMGQAGPPGQPPPKVAKNIPGFRRQGH